MMKQSKNKKGRLAKSTLSVVLAASMVMTSSSFVWASPVQDIPVEMSAYGVEELVGEGVATAWSETLSADVEGITGTGTTTYQWYTVDESGVPTEVQGQTNANFRKLDATDVGKTFRCIATAGEGQTGGPVTKDYTITPITVTPTITISGTYTYDGTAQQPAKEQITVKYTGDEEVTLSLGDFDVTYGENINAGSSAGTVSVNFTEAYVTSSGYQLANAVVTSFDIAKADLSGYTSDTIVAPELTYTGADQTPLENTGDLVVKNASGNEITLPDGSYTIKYSDGENTELETVKNAGDYSIASIASTDTDNFSTGTIGTVKFKDAENSEFTVGQAISEFKLQKPEEATKLSYSTEAPKNFPFKVVDSLDPVNKLTADDYDVKWEGDFTKVGSKVKATLTGKGNYSEESTGTFEFTIVADQSVSAAEESYLFTPDPKGVQPEVVIKDQSGTVITGLEKDVDYKVTYTNNTKVGTATGTVTFPGTGKLAGTGKKEFTFKITAMPVNDKTAQVEADKNQEFIFDGTAKTPVIKSVKYPYVGSTATLVENVDYKVEVEGDATDANVGDATYTATIKAIGNYGTEGNDTLGTVSFKIKPSDFNAATVKAEPVSIAYGQTITAADFKVVNIKSGEKVPNSEFTIDKYVLANGSETTTVPTDMGSYKAVLKYTGSNYKAGDTLTVDYTIGGKTLDTAIVAINYNNGNNQYYTYNPLVKGQVPTAAQVTVAIAGATLKPADKDGKNGDYKIDIPDVEDCKDAGVYKIKITGLNIYAGQTKEVSFEIKPKTIDEDTMFESVQAGTTHTGAAGTPYAVITDQNGEYTLEADKDYDMSVDTAKKTVSITGKGNYATQKAITKSYTVADTMQLSDPSIKAEVKGTYSWDKSAKEPGIDDIVLTEEYNGGSYTLIKGVDYDTVLTYKNNVNAGTAIVTVSAKSGTTRYAGTRDIEFEITGLDITADHKLDTTKLDKLSLSYSSEKKNYKDDIVEAVKVVHKTSLVALVKDTDYEVKFMQDGKEVTEVINPGTYTVSVEGTGNYTGKFTYDIAVAGISLDSVANIPSKLDDQAYTGQEITPEVAVTAKDTTKKLVKDVDYTVSYLNNVEMGTGYAVVKGIGIYGGTVLVPFNITGTDISKASVTVEGSYSYTGKAIVPTVTVKVGETVIDPANYDVVATDNTNAGTAKFTVVGKNNCAGTTAEATFTIAKADQKLAVSKAITDALKIRNTNANIYTLKVTGADTKLTYKSSNTKIASVNSAGKLSFKHVCGKATITVTAAADDNHNAATLKVAVAVKPATPKTTVTARSKSFNVKATAVKDITGYQVGYSTDKNFAASKTTKKLVGTTKALNKNFSGLTAKKGYYVRVRAYKKVGSTVYWGNWTSAKKITTK